MHEDHHGLAVLEHRACDEGEHDRLAESARRNEEWRTSAISVRLTDVVDDCVLIGPKSYHILNEYRRKNREDAMSKTRIYIVHNKANEATLVETASRSQAIAHVAKKEYRAEPATTVEVAKMVGAGVAVLHAGMGETFEERQPLL
jgi:hypothetical protein